MIITTPFYNGGDPLAIETPLNVRATVPLKKINIVIEIWQEVTEKDQANGTAKDKWNSIIHELSSVLEDTFSFDNRVTILKQYQDEFTKATNTGERLKRIQRVLLAVAAIVRLSMVVMSGGFFGLVAGVLVVVLGGAVACDVTEERRLAKRLSDYKRETQEVARYIMGNKKQIEEWFSQCFTDNLTAVQTQSEKLSIRVMFSRSGFDVPPRGPSVYGAAKFSEIVDGVSSSISELQASRRMLRARLVEFQQSHIAAEKYLKEVGIIDISAPASTEDDLFDDSDVGPEPIEMHEITSSHASDNASTPGNVPSSMNSSAAPPPDET